MDWPPDPLGLLWPLIEICDVIAVLGMCWRGCSWVLCCPTS